MTVILTNCQHLQLHCCPSPGVSMAVDHAVSVAMNGRLPADPQDIDLKSESSRNGSAVSGR